MWLLIVDDVDVVGGVVVVVVVVGGGGGGGVKTTMFAGYLLLTLVWKKQMNIEFNIQMTIARVRCFDQRDCNEKLYISY